MNKLTVILVVLLVLPIYLFVFNPSWQLGGLGLLLGAVGNFISPIALLYLIYYYAKHQWK